jgi:uroporphyrinogen III methyltransferase/synthase
VVLYDRLVDPRLLDEVSGGAARIFVGKKPGAPSMPQAAIDRLIVEHARESKRVVRLKGGDPFVFGRGADEAQALAAAGIAFEIVPGVTSAVAVPAYAGIPLTHSGVSSSFAVLTAHASSDRPGSEERWTALARGAETLVLMMGVASLEETTTKLVGAGRDADEPAAIVERGTMGDQRTVVGSVGSIARLARDAGIEPPAITIVGPVVALRDAMAWFESRPLFGVRVVVTRPRSQSNDLARRLSEAGAQVILAPTIRIEGPASLSELDAAIKTLADGAFTWAVFSSRNAVDAVFNRLFDLGLDARIFATTRIAAIGPATAAALERRGLRADLVPERFTGAAVAEALGGGKGRIFLPGPEGSPNEAQRPLESAGWLVEAVATYRTVTELGVIDEGVRTGAYDVVTFASGSAVRGFRELYGEPPAETVVACIGPSTAAVAAELAIRVDLTAAEHTAEGLVEALIEFSLSRTKAQRTSADN